MSVINWTVDRMNPVVLRESRQLVRSRFAVGIMLTFLLIMVVASAIYVMTMGGSARTSFSHGKNLFNILYYVLGYAAILFIPAHTALPFLGQQQTSSLDLLFTSTISPRSVIMGKMTSAFWMMTLLFSVSMPFMVFTVLLRGIGLLEVFLYLAMLAGLILLATMGFLLLVCLPTSRVFMGLLSIGYFLTLVMFPGILVSFSYRGINGEAVGTFLLVTALLLPVLGALATALISPAVSNRALGARITITASWLVAGIAAALGSTNTEEAWASISLFGTAIAMFACSSDSAVLSRRVQRAVPENRFLRIIAFPFFNGPVSGWTWCWGIGLITILATTGTSMGGEYYSLLLYAIAYSLLAVFIRRIPFINQICSEKYTWAIAVFLVMWGSILPLLANFVVNPGEKAKLLWRVGNPFAAFDKDPEIHVVFSACFCGLLVLLNLRWWLRQIAAFRPIKVVEPAIGED